MESDKGAPIASILGIGTAVPPYRIVQSEVSARLAEALSDYPDSVRWARRIFKQCGVETRYTCEPSLVGSTAACRYLPSSPLEEVPTTRERMDVYKRESMPLGLEAARLALLDSRADPLDVTHIITVSCTGQYLPGLDALLVKELQLSPHVNRIPLQFLGCAAGLKAICLARQLIAAAPSATILIVCVELCTLHIQPSGKREALFGASFFGDGASACIVGCAGDEHQGYLQLGEDMSVLLPDSSEEMVWEVGNRGFDLYLSPNIPRILGQYLPAELDRFLRVEDKPELWAIHPGGRGIVDTLQDLCALTDEQTSYSRRILRDYGNLSSATILFVLQEMRDDLRRRKSGRAAGLALAFGPGVTAEIIRIAYV
ncbi:type III polyketide synthase [Paenibacillus baekrokdamisoli]|nr:type III polyketide synthase [Paenibacillus baekrokdamisoli]